MNIKPKQKSQGVFLEYMLPRDMLYWLKFKHFISIYKTTMYSFDQHGVAPLLYVIVIMLQEGISCILHTQAQKGNTCQSIAYTTCTACVTTKVGVLDYHPWWGGYSLMY